VLGDIRTRQAYGSRTKLRVAGEAKLQRFVADAHAFLYRHLVGSREQIVGCLDGYQMQGLIWTGKGKVESSTAVGQGMEAEIANIALRVGHRVDTRRRKTLSFRRDLSCRSTPHRNHFLAFVLIFTLQCG
jgi:hypothetical protein